MVSGLASHAGDPGSNPGDVKLETLKISICCFSNKHAALRGMSKDRSAWSQYNVSEWDDTSCNCYSFVLAL